VEYWAATGLPQLRRNVVVQNMASKQQAGVFDQVAPLLVPGAQFDVVAAKTWFDDVVLPHFPL